MMIWRSSPIVLRTNSSTLAIRFSVSSMRVPLAALAYISKAPGIDLGEELAAQLRPQPAQRRHEQPDRDQHHGESIVHRAVELADVPAISPLRSTPPTARRGC